MRIVKESYYDKFICTAGDCIDTCCQGWQILIDDTALERFEKYDGMLKNDLWNAIDHEQNMMTFASNGKCPLLNEKGLCKLVLAEGEDFISEICHMYPRHVEEFDGIREWSLSISCPVAAKMLLTSKESLTYDVNEDDTIEPLYEDFEDFDFLLFTKLEDSRELIFNILKDRSKSIYNRMVLILRLSSKLQECIENDSIFEMDDIISDFDCGQDIKIAEIDLYNEVIKNYDLLLRFERLRDTWNYTLSDTLKLTEVKEEDFVNLLNELGKDLNEYDHNIILENLLFTYLFTYYQGAVYDDMIYAKCAMSVYSVLMIDYMVIAQKLIKERKLTIDDYIDIVYRFARETEHSDINLNLMEDECEKMFMNAI